MNNTPKDPDVAPALVSSVSDPFSAFSALNQSLLALQKLQAPLDLILPNVLPMYAHLADLTDMFRKGHISYALEAQRVISDSIAASFRSANAVLTGIGAGIARIGNLSDTIAQLALPPPATILEIGDLMRRGLATVDGFAARFSEAMRISIAAETAFTRFNGKVFGDLVGVAPRLSQAISSSVMAVSTAYAGLISFLDAERGVIPNMPPVVLDHPPLELFNIIDLAQSVTRIEPDPEVDQVEADIRQSVADRVPVAVETALADLHPNLPQLWAGAKVALVSTNPDRARHVATSLRELLTHILHILSPDKDVKQWSSDPTHYHNNEPTRRARLLFICRGINQAEFTVFVKKDIDALLAFMDLFQQGTHAIRVPFTDLQLEAMFHRTEATILFLLKISRSL